MSRFASFNDFVHLTSIIIVIAALYIFILQNHSDKDSSVKDPLIFISVISAREHYEYRRAIRETWGKWTKTSNAELKFAIGQECRIPPSDREFDQGCAEISWPHGRRYDHTFWSNTFTSALPTQRVAKGFSFIVNFPIVVNSVKLAKWGQTEGQTVVTLKNAHTREQLDSVQFSSFSQDEAELMTQRYLLPRGFEGTVSVEGNLNSANNGCHHWTEHGNFIKPTWLIVDDLTFDLKNESCVPLSFSFRFSGVNEFLQERDNRLHKWNDHLTTLSRNLDEENEKHNDLLFVETVDVYRNLTSKMLDIFKWKMHHRKDSFLLKVDDDTFVDYKKAEKYIERIKSNVVDKVWWWADLKMNWVVSRYGKWSDNVYLSFSYPAFPCGAAYVISPHFATLLGKNVSSLTRYPFEDTALGLWSDSANLSPILGRSDECKMDCGSRQSDCNFFSCFILQCKPEDMQRIFSSHERRGFVC